MTYEDRKKQLCQQCCWHRQCGYISRGLQDKCTTMREWMNVWELGYQDAVDKAGKWLIDNLPLYFGQINADNTDRFVRIFRKAMKNDTE